MNRRKYSPYSRILWFSIRIAWSSVRANMDAMHEDEQPRRQVQPPGHRLISDPWHHLKALLVLVAVPRFAPDIIALKKIQTTGPAAFPTVCYLHKHKHLLKPNKYSRVLYAINYLLYREKVYFRLQMLFFRFFAKNMFF